MASRLALMLRLASEACQPSLTAAVRRRSFPWRSHRAAREDYVGEVQVEFALERGGLGAGERFEPVEEDERIQEDLALVADGEGARVTAPADDHEAVRGGPRFWTLKVTM